MLIKGEQIHKIYKQNLHVAKNILDELGVIFWLDSGTLLGAVREGRAIKGDEDDIDLVTYCSNKVYLQKIIEKFLKAGFEILRLRETVLSVARDGNHVDIFFADKHKDNYYLTLYYKKKPFALVIPRHYFENFVEIKFYNKLFKVPYPLNAYVKHCYGPNWKTPIYRPVFENFNQEHEMRADWKFLKNMSLTKYEKRMQNETNACIKQSEESLKKEGLDGKILKINRELKSYYCILCDTWHKIDTDHGQKCLNKINRR